MRSSPGWTVSGFLSSGTWFFFPSWSRSPPSTSITGSFPMNCPSWVWRPGFFSRSSRGETGRGASLAPSWGGECSTGLQPPTKRSRGGRGWGGRSQADRHDRRLPRLERRAAHHLLGIDPGGRGRPVRHAERQGRVEDRDSLRALSLRRRVDRPLPRGGLLELFYMKKDISVRAGVVIQLTLIAVASLSLLAVFALKAIGISM